MTSSGSAHFEWLVAARSRNQANLLRLQTFSKQPQFDGLAADEIWRSVFSLLVGAEFSLWRGAFLVDIQRTWPTVLADAKKLLETLVRDNAVNYPQDRNTREWMSGYYLNNARLRLSWALGKIPPASLQFCDKEVLERFKGLAESDIEKRCPTEYWDLLHDTAEQLFLALENSNVKPKTSV
jgi:hypothetical protein